MANCNVCSQPILTGIIIKCKCDMVYHEECSLNIKRVSGFLEKCCASKAYFSLLYEIERMLANQSILLRNFIVSELKNEFSLEIDKRLKVVKDDLDRKILDNEDMIAELEERVTLTEKAIKEVSPLGQEETFAEMKDRASREKNELIFGVPDENNSDVGFEIKQLLTVSNIDIGGFRFSRIGKIVNGKIRPLKMNCINVDLAISALSVLSKLNKEKKHNYKCSPDYTPIQRDYFKKLVKTIKSYESAGDYSKQIKYIRGVPTIVSKN